MYVTLKLNGSPKKKPHKVLERLSRKHQEECEETAGQVRVRLSRTWEQSRKAQPGFPLIDCARRDQGLVPLRWSSCFSEHHRQTVYKSGLGPHGKRYLLGLLLIWTPSNSFLSDSTKGRSVHTWTWLWASLRMTGGGMLGSFWKASAWHRKPSPGFCCSLELSQSLEGITD